MLSDGGLPSLIACLAAAQTDSGRAAVCPIVWGAAEPTARVAAAARQAELCGLARFPFQPHPAPQSSGEGAIQTLALLQVTAAAVSAGFAALVWPVHAGPGADPDLDRVALSLDRALLVSRLVALDGQEHGCPAIRVDAPYADFTDRQIAELAIDLDAPVHTCWWWGGQDGSAAAERQRWTTQLQSCGWVPA